MPPSMQKAAHTSVRDRIAAFERQTLSDNAVIRARVIPDVKGVNRYKHFHVPKTVEPTRALMGHVDKKSTGQLPTLIQPGRIKLISNTSDGYEENGVEKAPRKSSRRERLPQLSQFSPRLRNDKEKDIVDYIEQQARQALSMNPSDSESSQRTRSSSRRLNDHITNSSTAVPERRTFAELGMRQNGMIINHSSDKLETSVPPRSKSAHEATDSTSESEAAEQPGSPSNMVTKDTATQTNKAQHSTRSVEILNSQPVPDTSEGGIEPPYAKIYKPDHREMLTAISQALDSTIDRYSRVRAEQAIINAARKQARVWRDAKEFIATQLVPQSIQLANKSKCTHRSAADIVKNIRSYP